MTPSRVTLLAFDFDGTLAPIQPDPSTVALDPELAGFLEEAAVTPAVVVAIVSGRDSEDLSQRLGPIPAYLVGSHGLEIHAPGGEIIRGSPPIDLQLDDELQEEILTGGLRIERKRHAIAVHWRGVSDVEAGHPLLDRFRQWGRTHALDIIEGRCVVEARSHGDGKEEALRWLASATGATTIIYAGDDTTDFGPLRFAVSHGLALFVQSEERQPPPGVTLISSRSELLGIVRNEIRL
jgi:trehalose-phosphatase